MARVTIEDCEKKVKNRFDLVMMGAYRARQISAGAPELVTRGDDKNTVIALREIAEGKVATTQLSEALIQSFQQVKEVEVPENFKQDTKALEIPDSDFVQGSNASVADQTFANVIADTSKNVVGEAGGFEDVDESELID